MTKYRRSADASIAAITAAIAILPEAEQGWQPIETAKDAKRGGWRVLLYNELWEGTFGDRQIGYWQEGKWLFDSEMNINDVEDEELDAADGEEPLTITKADWQPTHWRPLPAPPPAEGGQMNHWDKIRHQVETRKGSDLPRLNFEGLIETFAEALDEAADALDAKSALLAEAVTALEQMTGDCEHLLNILEGKAEQEWNHLYQYGRIDLARLALAKLKAAQSG